MVGELDLSEESWDIKLKWWAGTVYEEPCMFKGKESNSVSMEFI